ncbi:AI-2E family transporter [Adlercreutzia equolifaciens]|uniref:AI-2E family transporter n=1 Tax=Adlercreutzia equolifaciens TaxID=446660 RepID=UPI00352260FE
MSTDASQSQGGADAPASVNNPRSAAAAATAAANAISRTKQARARTRFFDLWAVVAAILLLAATVYLLNILSVPVAILIWTVIIVFCLRGIVNGLEKRHINRGLGTTIAYVIMALVLALIGFLLFSPMFGLNAQFNDLVSNLPHYVDAVIAWGNDLYTRYAPVLEDETVKSVISEVQTSAASFASSLAQGSASGIVAFSTTLANGLMALGFALVIAFWILLELPAMGRETRRLIGPKRAEDAEFFHATFTRVMGGYIKGTLLQCAVIGVGCGILFTVAGIPNAAVLGLITGVLNIIPIIGPWLGGALAAIAAIFVSPLAALIALAGTVVIQQLVYTFVSPKIMANSVDVTRPSPSSPSWRARRIGGAMSGLHGLARGHARVHPARGGGQVGVRLLLREEDRAPSGGRGRRVLQGGALGQRAGEPHRRRHLAGHHHRLAEAHQAGGFPLVQQGAAEAALAVPRQGDRAPFPR